MSFHAGLIRRVRREGFDTWLDRCRLGAGCRVDSYLLRCRGCSLGLDVVVVALGVAVPV